MKDRGFKFLVLVLLTTSLGFIGLSRSDADIKADQIIKTPNGENYFIGYSDSYGNYAVKFNSLASRKSYRFLKDTEILKQDLSDLRVVEGGVPIRNGIISCATQTVGTDIAGECSLIFANKKYPFASGELLIKSGFKFERAMFLDTSNLEKAGAITLVQQSRKPGVLINDNGTIKVITSSHTTVGVPSMAVLESWGWNLSDVVPATATDKLLLELNVLPTREAGQLDNYLPTNDEVAESLIMLETLSNYPDQPRVRAKNQTEAKSVLEFHKDTASIVSTNLSPYLTESSKQLWVKLPKLMSANVSVKLANAIERNTRAEITGVGDTALVRTELYQKSTKYYTPVTLAYKKEGLEWRLDLIESLKLQLKDYSENIPENYLANSDLQLVSAHVISSTGTGPNILEVEVYNNGDEIALDYAVSVASHQQNMLNDSFAHSYHAIEPKKSIKIQIPLIHLEQLAWSSGEYPLTVNLLAGDYEAGNTENKLLQITARLNESYATKIQ